MNIHKCMTAGTMLLFSLCSQAQKIVFDKESINVSTLWNRPVTAVYKFKNKGAAPLTVNGVDGGCGCITAKWPNAPIARGETGEITVTYDAKQLGTLSRIVSVSTNASDKPLNLKLKAHVSVAGRQTVDDVYPYAIDDIRLSASSVEFAEVSKGDSISASINVYNGSQDVFTPTLMHLPPYITAQYYPEMIARGRHGKISLTLHGDLLPDYGLTQSSIYLARFAGDKVGANNEISISAILLPDLSALQNSGNKPRFEISSTNINFGKIGKKKKSTQTVRIRNNGNTSLRIDRLQATGQAITVSLASTEIAPGESVKMNITLEAKYLGMSKLQPRVLIITNDPDHPKEEIVIKVEE